MNRFFTLFLMGCTSMVLAQTPTATYGEPYEIVDFNTMGSEYDLGDKFYAVDTTEGVIRALKVKRGGSSSTQAYYQVLDLKTLKETHRNADVYFARRYQYIDQIEQGSKILVFYLDYAKSEKNKKLYLRTMNPEDGSWEGEPQLLLEDQDIDNVVSVTVDRDRSHFNVQTENHTKSKKDNPRRGYYRFDRNFQQVASVDLNLPYAPDDLSHEGFLSVDGTAYALFRAFIPKGPESRKHKKDRDTRWLLQVVDVAAERVELIDLPTPKQALGMGHLRLTDAGAIQVVGYYVERRFVEEPPLLNGHYLPYNGTYSYCVTPKGALQHEQYHPFPLDVVQAYTNEGDRARYAKQAQKDESVGIQHLTPFTSSVIEIGQDLVLAGQTFYMSFTSNANAMVNVYGNAVLSRLDQEGNLKWVNKVPIFQAAQPFTYNMGSKTIRYNNSVYTLFYDHPNNQNLSTTQAPQRYEPIKKPVLSIYQTDLTSGKTQRHTLSDIWTKELPYSPKATDLNKMRYVGNGKVVFESRGKRGTDVLVSFQLPQ